MKILQLAYEYYNNLIIRKNINNNFLKTENVTIIQGWIPESKNDEFTTIIQSVLEEEYYLNFVDTSTLKNLKRLKILFDFFEQYS